MFRAACIAVFRTLTRHPLYAGLNLFGLALGIAVFVTLSLFVHFETGYEDWIPRADNIYLVTTTFRFPEQAESQNDAAMGGVLETIHPYFPGLRGTRLWGQSVRVVKGPLKQNSWMTYVDPDFFKVFDLTLVKGDKATALASPNNALITEDAAKKYFPGQEAMGQILSLEDGSVIRDYRVAGIIRNPPANSELGINIVVPIDMQRTTQEKMWNWWGGASVRTYLYFPTPGAAADFNRRIDPIVDANVPSQFASLSDVQSIHKSIVIRALGLKTRHLKDARTRDAVMTLGVVGVLAFLIAVINHVNLATAQAGMRARDIAVRKSLGAGRGLLHGQFMLEAALMTGLACLLGLSLVELGLPFVNVFGGVMLVLDYRHDFLVLLELGGAVVATGFLAGFYPAVILAGFKPAAVLASSRMPWGGRGAVRVREGLVILQFAVVIAFFIMVAGFFAQIEHMKSRDLGFTQANLIVTPATANPLISHAQLDALWNQWRSVPGVLSVTSSAEGPGFPAGTSISLKRSGARTKPLPVNMNTVGPDFFATYQAHLLAGRFLSSAYGEDQEATTAMSFMPTTGQAVGPLTMVTMNVVVDASTVRGLGFASPAAILNQEFDFVGLTRIRVVGVIADIRFSSPKTTAAPCIYLLDAQARDFAMTAVRYSGVPEAVMRGRLEKVWHTVVPDQTYYVLSADASLDQYYQADRNRSNLFALGAVIAALIGCIGLYGMAAFTTSRRSVEIGVRKVLGASRGQVVRLLIGRFMRPVLLANLLAWPVAYVALSRWLLQFDDRMAISPLYFLAATGLAALIAAGTVAGLAFTGAGAEPGKALRGE